MIQIKIMKWRSIASSEASTDWTPSMIVSFFSLLLCTPMAKCGWMKRAFHTPWKLPIMTQTRCTLIFHINHVHVCHKYCLACSCLEWRVTSTIAVGISLDENVAWHSMMKEQEMPQCILQADRLVDLSPSLNLLIEDGAISLHLWLVHFRMKWR